MVFSDKSPSFIKTHLNKSLANNNDDYFLCMATNYSQNMLCSVFCSKTLAEVAKVELPFQCDMAYCTIVGSVNGLICLADAFDGCKLYLCNLAIRKYKCIANSSSIHRCVPSTPYFYLGFGYHPQTNDNKVVRIMHIASGGCGMVHCEVEVYRFSDDCWSTVEGEFLWTTLNQLSATLVNGNIHWLVSGPGPGLDVLVLSFNLGEEIFREIAMPDYHSRKFFFRGSLCILKECLSLFEYSPSREDEGCEKYYLWVMKEYGVSTSWRKQYTIVLEGIVQRLLGINSSNEIVYKNKESKVVSYNLESHQTKYSSGTFGGPCTFCDPLIESLLFLEGGDGVLGLESSSEGTSCEGTTTTSFKEEEES